VVLEHRQRSGTGRDQVLRGKMRLRQQTDGTVQDDQPSDDMHKLTQETSYMLKEACHSGDCLRSSGNPLDECRRLDGRHQTHLLQRAFSSSGGGVVKERLSSRDARFKTQPEGVISA
jgi:hypothetical protein